MEYCKVKVNNAGNLDRRLYNFNIHLPVFFAELAVQYSCLVRKRQDFSITADTIRRMSRKLHVTLVISDTMEMNAASR